MKFKLKGTSFVQGNISNLGSGKYKAILMPEFDNEFDSTAVSVKVDGQHIGYLPRTWINDPTLNWKMFNTLKDREAEATVWRTGGFKEGMMYGMMVEL